MKVPRKALSVYHCSDEGSVRFALGGVQLDVSPGGKPQAAGTNGKILAVMTWEDESEPPEFSVIVPTPIVKNAANLGKPGKRFADDEQYGMVTIDQPDAKKTGLTITGTGPKLGTETMQCEALEGRFPKWRDVVPQYKAPVSIDLNAYELSRLLDALKPATDGHFNQSIRLTIETQDEENDPAAGHAATFTTGHEAGQLQSVGVIMPLYSDKSDNSPQPGVQPKVWA